MATEIERRRGLLLELLRKAGPGAVRPLVELTHLRGYPSSYEDVDNDLRVLEREGKVRAIDPPKARGRRWIATHDPACSGERQAEKETAETVARVLRAHRYYHREGMGGAQCECGVIAPLTVCDKDIRAHIAAAVATALASTARSVEESSQ
jgi:hypothetical protein